MEDAAEKAPHIQNEADSLLGEGRDQVIIPSLLSVDAMKVNLLSASGNQLTGLSTQNVASVRMKRPTGLTLLKLMGSSSSMVGEEVQ